LRALRLLELKVNTPMIEKSFLRSTIFGASARRALILPEENEKARSRLATCAQLKWLRAAAWEDKAFGADLEADLAVASPPLPRPEEAAEAQRFR
jgi:hypothetical protein